MRKVIYILLGAVLCLGAFGVLGLRLATDTQNVGYSRYWNDRGGDVRAQWRQGERESRTAVQSRPSRESAPRGWKLVEMTLDALNVLVGVVGIGLAVMGLRMQRPIKTDV